MTGAGLAARVSGLMRQRPFSGQVTLGPRALIALGSIAIISIGWAFYIGLLVGRDEQPREAVPALGELFRKENAPDATAAPAQEAAPPSPAPDLPEQARAPEGKASAMSGDAAAAWPAPPGLQTAPAGTAAAPATTAKAQPRRSRIYQIAAYRTSGEAAALASRLRIPGLRARVEPSGRVFLVIGSGRMSDAEDAAMRESLAEMGLGQPLPLSGKPAAKKAATPPAKPGAGGKAAASAKKQASPAKAAGAARTGAKRAAQKRSGGAQ